MRSQIPTGRNTQLHAIHAMLSDGHRSIRLENHTFFLWGLTAAFLILIVPELFSHQRFPDQSQRILFQNIFISVLLIGAGMLDYRWTRQKREARDESISFAQQQITKLWWMLIALVVILNIGMNVYGGGYLFYGITLILIGLGIYVHGLFSRQMLSWGGGLMIVLGLSLLATSPDISIQEWVGASAFGIGLPALALMVNKTCVTSLRREVVLSGIWFVLVLTPVVLAFNMLNRSSFDGWPQITYQDDLAMGLDERKNESRIVNLPAGTHVPVIVHIQGDVLKQLETTTIQMQTTRPVSIAIDDGEVQQMLRILDGRWKSALDYRIHDWVLKGALSSEGSPEVNLSFRLKL